MRFLCLLKMGYRTNGNCESILDQVLNSIHGTSVIRKEIGKIVVKGK